MTNWFQTDECYDFYSCLSFLEPFKFEVMRGTEVKGRIVGYIQKDGGKLKQFLSKRAIINGGPMLSSDITEKELTTLLQKCINNLKKKAIYIESRNSADYSQYVAVFNKNEFIYESHYNYLVETNSLEEVVNSFHKDVKRNIKEAQKNGVQIIDNPSIDDLNQFYLLIHDFYSKHVRKPLFSYEFFAKSLSVESIKCIIIKDNIGEVIGGGIRPIYPDHAVYAWYGYGNNKKFKKFHPSIMLNYASIKLALDNNCKVYDMMGAGTPSDGGYGVRDFKARFGGMLVEYGRFKCILNKPLYRVGQIGVSLMKKFR